MNFLYNSALWRDVVDADDTLTEESAIQTRADPSLPRARRTKALVTVCGLGVVALAIATFARHSSSASPERAFRASGDVELALLEPKKHKQPVEAAGPALVDILKLAQGRANGTDTAVSEEVSSKPGPGPWQCAKYVGDQDNDWCRTVGNLSGYEHHFFGQDGSPCGECWCCKREIEKKKTCAAQYASCLDEKCCETPGYQCYEKTPFWATCRPWCTPGPDPTDGNGDHWSCKELGPRAEGEAPPPDYSIKAAPWVAEQCAGRGQNCSESMCCQEAGLQCYTKDSGWAACKPECNPGPDPTDLDDSHWECKAIGTRTPGAAPGWGPAAPWVEEKCAAKREDCSTSQCCKDAGHQCYVKKEGWSMCMPSCLHGPMLTDANPDIWDCTPLGDRTPGLARAPAEVHVADWVSTECSGDHADCSKTMCCSNPTSQCYAKDDKWATCMRACNPGVHPDDQDQNPWSCAGLGPRTPRAWGHPSLYCISVVQIYAAEADTIRTQMNTDGGAGIFACEQFDVFSTDGGVCLGDGPNGPVWSQYFDNAAVGVTIDGTAGNTRLFMNVWEAVKIVGRYQNTDWTVKADPDAVLIPDRLREHLRPHTGAPTFVLTCTLPGMPTMMFGAVEALSKQALERYYEGGYDCRNNFPVDAWGEDRWLSACLQSIGAPGSEDFGMVNDALCRGGGCSNGAAAFHPFKGASEWQACYYEAMR